MERNLQDANADAPLADNALPTTTLSFPPLNLLASMRDSSDEENAKSLLPKQWRITAQIMRNSETLRQGVGAGANARAAAVLGASAGIGAGTGSSIGAGSGAGAGDEPHVSAGARAGAPAVLVAGAGAGGGGRGASQLSQLLSPAPAARSSGNYITRSASLPRTNRTRFSAITSLITRTNKQPQRNDATSLGYIRLGHHASLFIPA